MEGETAITPPTLALGAGQGIFLAALGVQEHREVRAHGAKALGEHLLCAGTHYHPVDIGNRPAEQAVAHGAADFVNPHKKTSVSATG